MKRRKTTQVGLLLASLGLTTAASAIDPINFGTSRICLTTGCRDSNIDNNQLRWRQDSDHRTIQLSLRKNENGGNYNLDFIELGESTRIADWNGSSYDTVFIHSQPLIKGSKSPKNQSVLKA